MIEALYLVLGQDHCAAPSSPERHAFGKGRKGHGYVAYDDPYAAELESTYDETDMDEASEWADELKETSKSHRSLNQAPHDEVYDPERNDITESNEAFAKVCFAQNAQVVRYVNPSRHTRPQCDMTVLVKCVFKTLAFLWFCDWLPKTEGSVVEFCASGTVSGATEFNKDLTCPFLGWFSLVAILALMLLAFACSQRVGCLKNALELKQRELDHLNDELLVSRRQSSALAVYLDQLQQAYDRRGQAYERARRAYIQSLEGDLEHGYEAAIALQRHLPMCPLGQVIQIQVALQYWHNDEDCHTLYETDLPIIEFQACPRCAEQNLHYEDEIPENFPHGADGTT